MSWIIFLKMDSSIKGIEKNEFNQTPEIQILYLGVKSFIIIWVLGGFRATPFARLISSIFWKGFSKETNHLNHPGFCELQNISDKICSL